MLTSKKRIVYPTFCAVLFIILLLSALLSINVGAVNIRPIWIVQIIVNKISASLTGQEIFAAQWPPSAVNIVWELRLPKVFAAVCVGAGLSLSGIMMQALTRNALAEPFVLGISSGASTGAVAAILMGGLPLIGTFSPKAGAFGGALLASILIFLLSGRKNPSTTRLVLTGMVLSSFFQAFTNLMIFLSPNEKKVSSAMFWMTGSLAGVMWEDVPSVLAAAVIGILAVLPLMRGMDAMLMGEERAITQGVNTKLLKRELIVLSSFVTGIMVSISGVIGFVGLVVPHVIRALFGSSHYRLIPASLLLGPIFLLWADVLARVLVRPEEMPIGILTAVFGVPFFLLLLHKSGYRFGE